MLRRPSPFRSGLLHSAGAEAPDFIEDLQWPEPVPNGIGLM